MEKTVSVIKKTQRQQIHVGLSEYEKDGDTFDMVFARVFYDDGAEYRPGRNGINVRVELLSELIAALQQAEAEARAAGLLREVETGPTGPTAPAEEVQAPAGEGTTAAREDDLTPLGAG